MSDHLSAIGLDRVYAKVIKPCEVCGGRDFALLQRYGRIGEPGVYGEMTVQVCRGCGFKMTNPRYEDQFYKDYYERLYREVAFGAEKPSKEYIAQQREQRGTDEGDAVRFNDPIDFALTDIDPADARRWTGDE